MKNVLILGGDLRLLKVADGLMEDGYKVSVFGIDPSYYDTPYNTYKDIISAVGENDIIILGLPASRDSLVLSTPCFSEKIYIEDFLKSINSKKIILGGMLSKEFTDKLSDCNCNFYDYYLREELIIKNVIPTVEGAISIAIEETPHTIHNSSCLICGFGRIGKLLSQHLKALGANVTVSARKLSDMAWIECFGYKNIKTDEICDYIDKYDIIFNTIPYNILTECCLKNMKKESMVIDLASSPGGVDVNLANRLGIKTIWALSLPGKTAPHTAGLIIKNTISNILKESGG